VNGYLYLDKKVTNMKKSELVKIIKTAVREELTASLPIVLSEIMQTEINLTKKTDPLELTKEILESSTSVQKPKLKKFSNNEALNKVLNETTGGIPSDGRKVGGGSYENKMTDLHGNEVSIESLPDHVSSALTRNYSSLLNKVDEKTNQKKGL
jgi:hypothetical protein